MTSTLVTSGMLAVLANKRPSLRMKDNPELTPIKDIIKQCWSQEPLERPTIDQVLLMLKELV